MMNEAHKGDMEVRCKIYIHGGGYKYIPLITQIKIQYYNKYRSYNN